MYILHSPEETELGRKTDSWSSSLTKLSNKCRRWPTEKQNNALALIDCFAVVLAISQICMVSQFQDLATGFFGGKKFNPISYQWKHFSSLSESKLKFHMYLF